MEQITITRDEFQKRIVKNPKGFGLVRAMREDPEMYGVADDPSKLALEEIAQAISLMEIENELFGKEGGERHKKKGTCHNRRRSDVRR